MMTADLSFGARGMRREQPKGRAERGGRPHALSSSPIAAVCFTALVMLGGCTSPGGPTRSAVAAPAPRPLGEAPFVRSAQGLIVVRVRLNETLERDFVIDTGSTMTTVTRSTAAALGLIEPDMARVMLHGMFESEERPMAVLDAIATGPIRRSAMPVAILEDPDIGGETRNLLGLDFFEGHALEFSSESGVIRLYAAADAGSVGALARDWSSVPLEPNPYGGPDVGLLFAKARLNGVWTPTLIDTGAAYSVLNWEAARDWRLKLIRKRQEEEWRAQGAIGEFSPRAAARYGHLQIGGRVWENETLTIFELRTQKLLGEAGAPIMIAGANLLADRDFLIDPARKLLFLGGPKERAECAGEGGGVTISAVAGGAPVRLIERASRIERGADRRCPRAAADPS